MSTQEMQNAVERMAPQEMEAEQQRVNAMDPTTMTSEEWMWYGAVNTARWVAEDPYVEDEA